jgi:Protein of unknown function (DUF3618)
MSTTSPGPDAGPEEIQADIESTRAQLAATVDALAAKFDVGAQARGAVHEARENVADVAHGAAGRAAGVAGKVKGTITGVAGNAADRVENVAQVGKVKAREAAGQVADVAAQLRENATPGHDAGPDGTTPLGAARHSRPSGQIGGATYSVMHDGALLVEPVPFYKRTELQVAAGVFLVGAVIVLVRGLR